MKVKVNKFHRIEQPVIKMLFELEDVHLTWCDLVLDAAKLKSVTTSMEKDATAQLSE